MAKQKIDYSLYFIILGLMVLLLGAFIGFLSSLVYIYPDFLKEYIPFNRLRPLHTSSVVSWIILTATGGIYYYLSQEEKLTLYSPKLKKTHFILFLATGVGIYYSYLSNNMGGREYLEYFPLLTIPILVGWVLFGINYYLTLLGKVKNWPVHYWMWAVGIIFMIYHLSEAHFWIFSEIRKDYIKDYSIQWKSYGSFVGSWNLLVYGTAIYVMTKIKQDDSVARGKKAFFFFFLGLTNLMFGWAHHTYLIPSQVWIRYAAYIISMTEWIIFLNIIYSWSKSLGREKKENNWMAYKFLIASEIWVFINLVLALLMSIPVLNYYLHGTHVTVAHSMGTTIGINTTILLGSVCYIINYLYKKSTIETKLVKFGYYLFNYSLLLFFLTLIVGGIYKIIWAHKVTSSSFGSLQEASSPIFLVFVLSGLFLFIGLSLIAGPMIKKIFTYRNK